MSHYTADQDEEKCVTCTRILHRYVLGSSKWCSSLGQCLVADLLEVKKVGLYSPGKPNAVVNAATISFKST